MGGRVAVELMPGRKDRQAATRCGRSVGVRHPRRTQPATLERLSRRDRDERGFTLIELMVVVLIIAVLIAIAIPTFLGARQRAQDRAAQSNVRTALTAEKTFFTDQQLYTETAADLTAIEPSLNFTNAAGSLAASGSIVYVKVYGSPAQTVVVGAQSGSGKCFWLRDTSASPGTQYLRTNSPCVAPDATTAMTSSW
jgi:type IV pilus assembly protein PilA